MMRLTPMLLLLAAVTACKGEQQWNVGVGSTTPRYERPTEDRTLLGEQVVPVRVGELGPSFAACNARGALRERTVDRPIPVRAAPYDRARQVAQLPLGADFFICTRSLDQRWLGVVFDRSGRASRACGVAAPMARRQDYAGPCVSGWVESSQVRLVAAVDAVSGAADDVTDLPVQGNVAEPANGVAAQ